MQFEVQEVTSGIFGMNRDYVMPSEAGSSLSPMLLITGVNISKMISYCTRTLACFFVCLVLHSHIH